MENLKNQIDEENLVVKSKSKSKSKFEWKKLITFYL